MIIQTEFHVFFSQWHPDFAKGGRIASMDSFKSSSWVKPSRSQKKKQQRKKTGHDEIFKIYLKYPFWKHPCHLNTPTCPPNMHPHQPMFFFSKFNKKRGILGLSFSWLLKSSFGAWLGHDDFFHHLQSWEVSFCPIRKIPRKNARDF